MTRVQLLLFLCAVLVAAGCGDDGESPGGSAAATGFVSKQRIVYSDGLHSENTEMIKLGERILLVFRGGETGQTGSARAHINVFESTDNGKSFTKISEVSGSMLPGGRDIRDPKLVEMGGRLFLYCISRVPGAHYRDLFGEAWTVRAESTDGGHTWSLPEKTFTDVTAGGNETYWGFWRFTKRTYSDGGIPRTTVFATGYNDGDSKVGFFASDDGVTWQKRSVIISSPRDVPSEAELQFFGANSEIAVSLVRLDNQDIIADGQTAICTAHEPFTTWECGRRIEARLDGPTWVLRPNGTQTRSFVFARKHLPCTYKRTTAYELRGDLSDPAAPIEVCEIEDLKSSGDTAYTAVVPLSASTSLLSWYSSHVDRDIPWLEGQFTPSDIWLATIDFDQAPTTCTHPPAKRACIPPPLPPGNANFAISGEHYLVLAPVIWPAQSLYLRASVALNGATLDLSLQPLDAMTKEPVGTAWSAPNVVVAADGSFDASLGMQPVPGPSFPLLDDPFLQLGEFHLIGKATSADGFCGYATGFAQVLGSSVADQIRLEGSTFGAVRINGGSLPVVNPSCPGSRR